jgi:site-specific recombinase XerD
MTVYLKKTTGKWKAEIWFNSKRYGSRCFSKKAMAEKYEREKISELEVRHLTGTNARDCSYNEIFSYWKENAFSRKRSSSLVKDLQMHRDFIEPVLGSLKISEITPQHFELIVSAILKRGLSKCTANKVIQHFKAVFNHSFNNETIARNPAKSFKQLRLDSKEMDYLSKEEMEQFLTYTSERYVGEERWKHVLGLTLFLTGARLGEVLGLEWGRINFDRDSILISQMWSPIERKLIYSTKGRKDRVIPLNSYLKTELAALRNSSKGSFIFSDAKDGPIDPNNFRKRNWEKDFKDAKVKAIRIHDARHTYASLFMMAGGNLYELKEVLGHTSIKTTERYAHLSSNHLAGVKDIIKPLIGNGAGVLAVSDFQKRESSRLNHAQEKSWIECVL